MVADIVKENIEKIKIFKILVTILYIKNIDFLFWKDSQYLGAFTIKYVSSPLKSPFNLNHRIFGCSG